MTELPASVVNAAAFQPSAAEVASVHAWFAEYDARAAKADLTGLADLAMFPLNVVSDDSGGNGSAAQWDRDQYLAAMAHVVGGGDQPRMESVRTPHFLTGQLVLVFTEATFTTGDHAQAVRYADLLVKRHGRWYFQTMVQGGWGDQLAG